MKKKKNLLLFLIAGVALFSFSNISDKADDPVKSSPLTDALPVTSKQLDANNISAWFRTNGSFNRDPSTGNGGFEWPKFSGKTARYASGIWMGCISGTDTLTAVAEYAYDYLPGYVDNNGLPQGTDNPLYRIYSIISGDTTSPDYLAWPVNQGAYVTPAGKPLFLGQQTMFYCYTDAYPHTSGQTSTLSLKAQILQTNWCYSSLGLNDAEFIEFKVINRSAATWTNAYIAFWTDDDLGDGLDDKIGCDTNLNLGYTYNATDSDPIYGTAPPAVGTKLLRSPIVATGNMNDTIKYYDPPGSSNLRIKTGYKYSGMNIFNTYNNSSPQPSDPGTNVETYRVLSGLWRLGNSWVNPTSGDTTKKSYSGNPELGTGWIMPGASDRRFLLGFGPLSINPGDTQSIIVAQLIARGSSNLNSITKLRQFSSYLDTVYNANFPGLVNIRNILSEIPKGYGLMQNYPNPFNPATHIRFAISDPAFVTLKVFDILGNEVAVLLNEKKNSGTYEAVFDGSNLPSGIYFYKLTAGEYNETKSMILVK